MPSASWATCLGRVSSRAACPLGPRVLSGRVSSRAACPLGARITEEQGAEYRMTTTGLSEERRCLVMGGAHRLPDLGSVPSPGPRAGSGTSLARGPSRRPQAAGREPQAQQAQAHWAKSCPWPKSPFLDYHFLVPGSSFWFLTRPSDSFRTRPSLIPDLLHSVSE